ncbi:DUF72 domain-containing protein [Nocardia sp. NPDC049149]|uniref:DUF72 domain-containing protein n=1 Tax=Nocardia sp. NPDC049149 TaxID=3364315 RepID=UPI00370FB861
MRLHVGCAMWTHAAWQEWQPASGDRLAAYAARCNAVEGNTTFYAIPAVRTVESWAAQLTPEFRFLPKLHKSITHERRLNGADEELRTFLSAIEPLGPSAHALWIQLPSSFGPNDLGALAGFLRELPRSYRCAVEVRHPAFFENEQATRYLERVLARVHAEWLTFDTTVLFDGLPTPGEQEAWSKKPRVPLRTRALTEYPIVRYHGRESTDRTVEGWQRWVGIVADWLREGRSPTVFLHTPNNADAVTLARRFHAEVAARVPELEPLPEPAPTGPMTLF